jgi:hypothetical protein
MKIADGLDDGLILEGQAIEPERAGIAAKLLPLPIVMAVRRELGQGGMGGPHERTQGKLALEHPG